MAQQTTNSATQGLREKLKEHKEAEEERLIKYLSEKYGIPTVQLTNIRVNPEALQIIKEKDAREARMAVYERLKKKLTVAVNEPKNENLKKQLSEIEGRGFTYELTMASTKTLEHIWKGYRDIVATSASSPGTLTITNEDLQKTVEKTNSVEAVRELLKETKTMDQTRRLSKNIEYIVSGAIAINTSDIHIEPAKNGGVVRYRVDGILTDVMEMTREEFKQTIIRMKLIAGMKITTKGAQDGGFVIHLMDRAISVRASVIPEDEGGSFVLRLLDPDNVIHSIDVLGLHPAILEVFEKHIKRPNGMVLTTGPTGSGKTTTLYSFLNVVKNEEIKIITLEDPIEYRLEGIVQTQIDKKYSFASGLRAILRQDPDVILVGEIRDEEVAETAVQAALTGHLVFSTLHTNDALGALPRLAQLEIDPQTFARAINIVIAQRLARKLCPHCSEPHPLTQQQKETIRKMIEEMPEKYRREDLDENNIRRPGDASKQCEHCSAGYKGRMGIFEVFEVDDEVEKTYREKGGMNDLKEAVKKQGLPFMKDDGLWKVLKGVTSLSELERTIGVTV